MSLRRTLQALRAFSVTFGGSVALSAISVAGLTSAARALARRRAPKRAALAACGATTLYLGVVRPWHLRWGSEPGDLDHELPGDELLPASGTEIAHAVTVDAPPEAVWPWVAQIGQDRGGFYSYEWLENLAGCEVRNADRVHPEWQHREVGETVYLHPSGGLEVSAFEPGRAIGLRNWGTFVVEPTEEGRTRLISHGRVPAGPSGAAYAALMEIPHFVMERRMLIGIKERAEQARTETERR